MALTKLEEILEDNLDYQFIEQGAIPSIKDCCRIYTQSQTQELKEQNAELVEMLLCVQKILEERYVINYASQIHFEIKELLTKYKHLNQL